MSSRWARWAVLAIDLNSAIVTTFARDPNSVTCFEANTGATSRYENMQDMASDGTDPSSSS